MHGVRPNSSSSLSFPRLSISCWPHISAQLLHRLRRFHEKKILTIGLVINIGVLLYCKYANFFVAELKPILSFIGMDGFHWTHIALPIGISFFTFQKISYLIDVYRKTTSPCNRFSTYLLYVSLFPQLIAGPIIRYHDVAQQLQSREHSSRLFLSGVWRFCLGLSKKVILANTLGEIADNGFTLGQVPSTRRQGICILCYTMQIYYDFSGYSDMAIGLGRMLGFHYLENFNAPYISRNFTEFWKRWHISLSNWMREYLYFPLGGNRFGKLRTSFNLWLVFLLSGIWHGASWNFLIWGAYHGFFISLDKLAGQLSFPRIPKLIAIPVTFLLVMIGWVFFGRRPAPCPVVHLISFRSAFCSSAALDHSEPSGAPHRDALHRPSLFLSPALYTILYYRPDRACGTENLPCRSCSILLLNHTFYPFAGFLVSSSFNPFIYFRF